MLICKELESGIYRKFTLIGKSRVSISLAFVCIFQFVDANMRAYSSYLQTVFATDLHSRAFLQLPKSVGVDFRASYVSHTSIYQNFNPFCFLSLLGTQIKFRSFFN